MRSIPLPSPRRAGRMVQRNLLVYKHVWMVIFSGFFEPLFYLLSIGLGVGAMVSSVNGIAYPAFVAPGLLAASCMNGAMHDGLFNMFFKLHFKKTYDGILATPMRVPDVALGELLWALIRSMIYATGFLTVLFVIGGTVGPPLILSPLGVLALPAAVLASASFSAVAVCLTSFIRKIQDFDMVMGLFFMPMFLFSGVFFPITQLPVPLAWLMQATPLYHGVEILRQLTTGHVDGSMIGHLTYLVCVGVAAFVLAMLRLERSLIK